MNAASDSKGETSSPWSTWVADSIQMGLIVLDEQGRVCLFNHWMSQSSGLSFAQVAGRNLFDIFPELSIGRVGMALKTCLETGLPAVLSNSLNPTPFPLFADAQQKTLGVRRQQSVRIMRSPQTEGSASQVLIEVVDVSAAVRRERKLQELNATLTRSTAATQAALRDNEALLTTINLYAIVSVADRHGVITDINDAFCEVSGYTREELLGQNHRIINSGVQPPEFWVSMWKQISIGLPWRGEVCNRAKNGSLYWVDTFISPFVGDDGKIDKFISIRVDITANKATERELKRATEAAQEASRSKSQFLANMSHEIRTPMNAILGMLRLLHSTELTPRQLDYASKSEGAAKSLLGLLNDILDFSKIDAGKMELDPQPFRVDRLLRDLSVIVSANVGPKPVEVLFDIDPEVPKVLIGDSMRLQQVLINLSGNAIKFTAEGEVVIQIKVLAFSDSKFTLKIAVRDTGIGIAPENQKHIFDGFSQAEASTTRRFGGTGLGLSISRRLVTMMGGELSLASVLGQGSTFYFTITLPAANRVADDPATPPERLASDLDVLIVDDNAMARELLASMAQSWGWRVDAAESGPQALALIAARAANSRPPYQLFLVDWQMPDMDGWETIARIEKLNAGRSAPITIMVTSQGREMLSKRNAQEQARLNAFLVKPITASMLFDAVADARAGLSNLRARPRVKTDRIGRLQGLHLLVVEDNRINQQVADELLRAEGASIEIAENGQLGLNAIAKTKLPFDAVLMDVQMPVMDGYTATRAIRHDMKLTDLPVIAMTANAMASDRAACLEAGMNDHVGKPFDLPHLVAVLLRYVRPPTDPNFAQVAVQDTSRSPASGSGDSTGDLSGFNTLDVDGALARLGGNVELYRSILRTYLGDIVSLPDQLTDFLNAGDLVGANRLLHTIKGLSATVGANHMAEIAKVVESSLRQTDAKQRHPQLLVKFRNAVTSTSNLLDQVAQKVTIPRPNDAASLEIKVLNLTELVADLRKLHGLLKNSDMSAISVHQQIRKTHGCSAEAELTQLNEAMKSFDFAQGAMQCERMIQQLNHSV
jgi:two-component system sensor histidine kinase/response regulator